MLIVALRERERESRWYSGVNTIRRLLQDACALSLSPSVNRAIGISDTLNVPGVILDLSAPDPDDGQPWDLL